MPANEKLAITRDVAEERLKESISRVEKEFSESLVESMPGVFFLFDHGGRFLRWNKNLVEVSGYTAAEVSRMLPLDFFAAEDKQLVHEKIGEAFAKGRATMEANVVVKNGRKIPFLFTAVATALGGSDCLLGTGLDISQRKRAEEEIRMLARFPEENPNPVLRSSAGGKLLYANSASRNLMNCWKIGIGQHLPPDLVRIVRKALSENSPTEIDLLCGDKVYQFCFAPVLEGSYVNLYGRDNTERKLAEEALRKLNETLEQRVAERAAVAESRSEQLRRLALELSNAEDQERKQIALILHDDLQQYLAAVRFQLQRLNSTNADDRVIGTLIQWMDESIQKCRSLSHELSPPVLHQSGLLAALDWLASDMREKHGLKVQFTFWPEAEPQSPSLASMLFRSVRELLFNAVKHSGADSAVVEAKNRKDRICIRVKDEGKGFDPAAAEAEYEKMTGFGLFTIKERVSFMGGRFEVESAPGKGCCITLEVPRDVLQKSATREARKFESVSNKTEAGAPREAKKIKILVADDHAVMRQGLANLLENENDIEVIAQAGDGREAVRLAKELNPDVVLMDVSMPEMSGAKATAKIQKRRPHIRIIGLSMHDDPATKEKMIKAGATAYLYKASPAEKLLETIRGSLA